MTEAADDDEVPPPTREQIVELMATSLMVETCSWVDRARMLEIFDWLGIRLGHPHAGIPGPFSVLEAGVDFGLQRDPSASRFRVPIGTGAARLHAAIKARVLELGEDYDPGDEPARWPWG